MRNSVEGRDRSEYRQRCTAARRKVRSPLWYDVRSQTEGERGGWKMEGRRHGQHMLAARYRTVDMRVCSPPSLSRVLLP